MYIQYPQFCKLMRIVILYLIFDLVPKYGWKGHSRENAQGQNESDDR